MRSMNEVTLVTAEIIWTGYCPCGGMLCEGPRGGLSINVKCVACGNEYNIPPRPWLPQEISSLLRDGK
jgi:hypothetical protein